MNPRFSIIVPTLDNLDDLNGKTFFLCGPLDFVKSIKEILFDLGIDKSQIKQEAYG